MCNHILENREKWQIAGKWPTFGPYLQYFSHAGYGLAEFSMQKNQE